MFPQGLGASWEQLALVAVSVPAAYLALVLFSRIAGLRSFSQMTNFDLAATVAFGSMLATTIVSNQVPLLQGVLGLALLFIVQALVAMVRRRNNMERTLENRPLMLMHGSQMLPRNMRRARVTENDLYAKLRLAGVTRFNQVEALVLETTGEVSVLLRGHDGQSVNPKLLASVTWEPETSTHR